MGDTGSVLWVSIILTCLYIHNSIGSLGKYPDEKDVKGILVTNCTLRNTENGIRIKTWAGSPPSQATALTFQDIVMHNVRNPIIIDQSYGSNSNKVGLLGLNHLPLNKEIKLIIIPCLRAAIKGTDQRC